MTLVSGQFGEVCLSRYVYNGDGLRTRGEGNRGLTWDYVWGVAGGSHYLRARYYDPAVGRFLSQDTVRAVNPYFYVGSNPVNYTNDALEREAYEGENR